jgi:hypothetical protein
MIYGPDFRPSKWSEELYPIIDHADTLEEKVRERNKTTDLATKLRLLNERTAKIRNKAGVDKDILQLLTIQSELINHLFNRPSENKVTKGIYGSDQVTSHHVT